MGETELYPDRWHALSPKDARQLTRKLKSELSKAHPLYKLKLQAAARLHTRDDVLFRHPSGDGACFVVHLTWRKETLADFPWCTEFEDIHDFRANWKRIWDD